MCVNIIFGKSPEKLKKIFGNHKNQAVNLQTNVINVVKGFYKNILFAGFCLVPGIISAQNQVNITLEKPLFNAARVAPVSLYPLPKKLPTIDFHALKPGYTLVVPILGSPAATVTTIDNNLYTQRFGFFCRKELLLEKQTRVPLRFRLGGLEYVDRLEGKAGYK